MANNTKCTFNTKLDVINAYDFISYFTSVTNKLINRIQPNHKQTDYCLISQSTDTANEFAF